MDFAIVFDDQYLGTLSKTEVDYFAFYCSILKVNATCKFILKSIDKENLNKIKVGTPFTVKFYDNNVSYENKMKILTFSKVEGEGITDYVKIIAVSPLFFNNSESTIAYSGSVSQIINTLLKTDLKDITNYNIETTEDRNRIRYRVAEEPQEFITRIMKYGNINGNPIYMYHDAQGCFNLKGISSLKSTPPAYISVSSLTEKGDVKIEISDSIQQLTMMNYTFNINNGKQVSNITSIFNTELFKCPNDVDYYSSTKGLQEGNASVESVYPSRTDFYDWYVCPDDAKSISLKRNFEDLGMFQLLSATYTGFMIKELDLGKIHYVILPYNPTEKSSNGSDVNSSEGTYMVMDTTFIFENGVAKTQATMTQVGY